MVKKKSIKKIRSTKIGLFEKFTLAFYDHMKLSVLFWISIFIFGFFSYTTFMQRQGFPQVSVPISLVKIVYLANDKAVVDKQVTSKLVEAVQADPSVEKSTSTSTNNGGVIVVQHTDKFTSGEGSKSIESAITNSTVKIPPNAVVEYSTIDAARFNNKYDVLVSVNSPSANLETIIENANVIGKSLDAEFEEITNAETISPITEGINPISKKPGKIQTQFDWQGISEDGELKTNNSVVIGINFAEGTDLVKFNKLLESAITEHSENLSDKDIAVVQAVGFAESIEQQTDSLQNNLFEGLLIVILICLIFIGARAGLTAAAAMAVTLSTTIAILYAGGATLNTITLFGLVLCLGLIVDDIVIITESIDAQRQKTKNLREAVTIAVKKIARASSAGTFTTALAFAPLLFFGGILGKFIKIMPITIILSLVVSLIVSLAFVPLFIRLVHFEKKKPHKYNPLEYLRSGVEWVASSLSRIIVSADTTKKKAIYSLVAILVSLTFLMASGPLYSKLKFDIFPTPKDSNELQIEYSFIPGTTIDKAIDITRKSNDIISDTLNENILRISYQGNANERQATARITLTPYEEREVTSTELVTDLQQQLDSVENATITVSQLSAGPPKERLPFVVQIKADDQRAADIAANNLVKFLDGNEVSRSNGTTASIAETEYTGELITITRINGERVVQVRAGFDADDTTAIVQSAKSLVEEDYLSEPSNFPGLGIEDFGFDFGSESDNQESFQTVIAALPILLLLMYLLLVFQFKSLLQPLLILLAVPFSFFGVGLALNLTNNPISFFTMIGFFALIGISVNNTILLTDFANQGRKRGLSPRQAMAGAVHERLRPLLTTTITSVCALIPLTLSDPFWESLSITLIGGLLSSAFLVIISFPYFYLILEHSRNSLSKKLQSFRGK